jgi:ectoine hydroxylase-related dioxygenase (phytanoyl-CoA dioxygenase family)
MKTSAEPSPAKIELFAGHRPNPAKHLFPDIDYICEELSLNGYCVIPNEIAPVDIDSSRAEIDRLLAIQQQEFGAENLRQINDHGVVRSPFLDSDLIREVCFSDLVLKILYQTFAEQVVLHVNRAVVSDPAIKHPATVWHREPPYVDFTASRPLALTFLHLVDESNNQNGGLTLLPGSHKWEHFPSDEFVRRNRIVPSMPSGALLVFNSLLFHAGTENTGSDLRRSLVTIFTSPIIKQQVDIPNMIRNRGCENVVEKIPNGQFLLGFQTELRKSDDDYRQNKLEQTRNG